MMKNLITVFLTFLFNIQFISAQQFENWFSNKTMRVDYYHTGTKGKEIFSLDKIYEEGIWSGTRTKMIDPLNLGEYLVLLFDTVSGTLLYTHGFSSIFQEWQTTEEAISGKYRTFSETVLLPMPKLPVRLSISRRDSLMKFNELFSFTINPNSSVEINKEKRTFSYSIVKVVDNGPSEKKADMLILADGYAKKDLKKLRKDVKHFVNLLFDSTPFKERKKDFNVWSIETISEESGIDKSDKNVWKKTALGTMYNTFGSPRYVLTEENRTIRDISSAVPYDFIVILVNDNRYGGGGIFNLYATCYTIPDTKGQEWQLDYVFVHELGHSFAGLADEYYTSQVSYIDIYPKGVEPWEPNITSLLTQTQIKWKGFVTADTPIPTPWNKSAYDSVEAIKRKLDRLASDYYEKREPLYRAGQNILKSDLYSGKVGAFEGAGYISKGMYRPAIDCRMFSLSLVPFCPICRNAIEQMIDYYVK